MPLAWKQQWLRVAALACIVVALLYGCGGGGSGGPDPTPPRILTTLSISPSNLTLEALGATSQLQATARDQDGNTMSVQFSWSSSDTAVLTVDANGLVTASGNGSARVTVRTGGSSNSTTVRVQQRPARIEFSGEDVVITALGAIQRLEASVFDANDHAMSAELTWESSDPSVVTIDGDGRITAQANGTATIAVTVRDRGQDISASIAITVRAPPPPIEPLTVSGNPNARDPRTGRTLLHVAAIANAPRLIAALLAAGADVEARDKEGLTPLHAAAAGNGPAAIAALLEAGADLHARNYFMQTPLQYAVSLVSTGSYFRGRRVLNRHVPAAVAALLEAGAEPNVANDFLFGTTPLNWIASDAGSSTAPEAMTILATLLEAGADPNVHNHTFGTTPLDQAVQGFNPAAAAALLKAGANPNARDFAGLTPLWSWAAVGKNPAILAAMLEAGADLDMRDDNGATLMHLAAERDKPATIAALLEAGMELEARDHEGRTPLHAAAASTVPGSPVAAAAAIAVLLEAGADANARDESGHTALELAPDHSAAMMTVLLEAEAGRIEHDPNARDEFGYTALHAAARANSPKLIAALLEAGADIDAPDTYGFTPLSLAAGGMRLRGRNLPPPTYSPAAITALAVAGANLAVTDEGGLTPLQGALKRVRERRNSLALAAVAALAQAAADLGSTAHADFMALLALAAGNPAAIPGRVQAGADPDARDEAGRTVLHRVVVWEDSAALAAVTALKEAGADLNIRDNNGWMPLALAAYRNRPNIVSALLEAGADPNGRDTRSRTALHWAASSDRAAMVAALAAAGVDLNVRDSSHGRTALQWATDEGQLAAIAALAAAGADFEAQDREGRTALQLAAIQDVPWIAGDGPATVAALVEAGADLGVLDADRNTLLHVAAAAGQQATTVFLRALGAKWTSSPDADQPDLNARIVAVELFQGPMVWHWEPAEPDDSASGSDISEARFTDHAKTLLRRATTAAVRIGSESPEPMPELTVSLTDANGRSWTAQVDPVHEPGIVSLPSNSESGLWETEYVYELPVDWVDSGHRAVFSIDPFNRLEETDENDNTATLRVDGYAVPVFDVTFVPIVFSDTPPVVDTDTYMAAIGDLLPIGDYRARIGDPLDLSGRNLGVSNVDLTKQTAIDELLHRWNAEALESEYYYGLLIPDGATLGFGGLAYSAGKVAVSDAIGARCQVERVFCGSGVHAHELGHNFGLRHAPGDCDETEPIDLDFPYSRAGIGPRRGWVASRNEFIDPGDDDRHFDIMGYCNPRFVSDYNYNNMVDYRLGDSQSPPDDSERIGPSFEIGPNPSIASSPTTLSSPTLAIAQRQGAAASSDGFDPGLADTEAVVAIGPSLAFTGAVDEYGLWSIGQMDASTQPPRPPRAVGDYFFTLQDTNQREIHREPMSLLTLPHGDTGQAWAVRVPAPDQPPAFLAILDANGTPLFIQPIEVPGMEGE